MKAYAIAAATAGALVLVAAVIVSAQEPRTQKDRPGTPPKDVWNCPVSHPIKGNFTTSTGERCIYHVRGGEFYDRTKPERCYVTEIEAGQDDCRKSKR